MPHRTIRASDVHADTSTARECAVGELRVGRIVATAGAIVTPALAPGAVGPQHLAPDVLAALALPSDGTQGVFEFSAARLRAADLSARDVSFDGGALLGTEPVVVFARELPEGASIASLALNVTTFWEEQPDDKVSFLFINSAVHRPAELRPVKERTAGEFYRHVDGCSFTVKLRGRVDTDADGRSRYVVEASFRWHTEAGAAPEVAPGAGHHVGFFTHGVFFAM